MAPEQSIRDLLVADTTIASVIGARIYPGFAPQKEPMPHIVYSRASTEVDHHMGGYSGLRLISLDLELYGTDSTALQSLAKRCEAVLDSVNDRTTASGVSVARLWMDDQRHTTIELADGTGRPIHNIRQTYRMHYHGN